MSSTLSLRSWNYAVEGKMQEQTIVSKALTHRILDLTILMCVGTASHL
jgi:hypothetical protein